MEALELLEEIASGSKKPGNKKNWPRDYDKARYTRAHEVAARALAEDRLNALGEVCADRLLARLAGFVLSEAAERRRQGRFVFHDLLVQARNLLRDPDRGRAVRRSLRRKYRRLLIDEFQDTDPLQVELAMLIAS